jgi:hypothetical protein
MNVAEFSLQHHRFGFEHPAKEEPHWKSMVDRWYQLDAYAYGLAQAYSVWKPTLDGPPSIMILASALASNETDLQFAKQLKESGIASASKFVHTLPNIRCSSLCQVMNWNGPVLCFQKDPFTQVQALREALGLLESDPSRHSIWVLSVLNQDIGSRLFEAQLFVLTRFEPSASDRYRNFKIGKNQCQVDLPPLQPDQELQEWLDSGVGGFPLPGGYEVRKKA